MSVMGVVGSEERVYHEAYLEISFPILAQFLAMPEGMEITGVTSNIGSICPPMTAIVKVRDARLPGTVEGNNMPRLEPMLTEKGDHVEVNWNADGLLPGVESTKVMKPR